MMKKPSRKNKLYLCIASILLLSACATNSEQELERERLLKKTSELEQREKTLAERENLISSLNKETNQQTLLPPNAKAGECYARVWVEPTYENKTEQVKSKSSSYELNIIPAQYETVEERVLISEASSSLVTIPAAYDWVTKKVTVVEAKRSWHTESYTSSPLATRSTLETASKHGINLDEAESGMCFHEHYHQPQFTTTEEQVLLSEASEEITSVEAEYETVTKKILIKEASTKLIKIPAEYDFISKQVIDKPAHQIWKKGNGPIQKLDDATGEIMCLVDVPATYKTVTNRVIKSSATTKEIEIPAEYKTVQIKELIKKPAVRTTSIPAKYSTVTKEVLLKDGEYVWHEIHDLSESKQTRTGNKICLVEKPAKYETVKTKVVVTPATHQKIDVPAKYETVSVQKLVKDAREVKTELPAEYETITHQKLVEDGYMEWRSILCETNMTQRRISQIQKSLAGKGYYSGKIDGVVGTGTMSAVNAFQRDNKLPVDKYLNIETVKELNISTY